MLHARRDDDKSLWAGSMKLPPTQDGFRILEALDALWPRLVVASRARPGGFRLRMVGVTLAELALLDIEQGSLFGHLAPDEPLARETRHLALLQAMDRINERFGRNAVTLGPATGGRIDRIGSSIAFGRIPEIAEFHE